MTLLAVVPAVRLRRAWFCAFTVVLALSLAAAASAGAANYVQRYSTNTNGSIAMAANTLETCPSSESGCTAAQSASTFDNAGNSALNNNNYTMRYVNIDPASGRFNSSSSDLGLPAGATVLWAGLY